MAQLLSPRALTAFRWIAGVLVAVVVTLLIWSYYNRDNLVAGCERNSARAALAANGFMQLYDRVGARANSGDSESADRYRAVAISLVRGIPRKGEDGVFDQRLIEARFVDARETDANRPRFELTEDAKRRHAQGCEEEFPPPVSFIR